eukprot:7380440-Prymnesium_polylepis.2
MACSAKCTSVLSVISPLLASRNAPVPKKYLSKSTSAVATSASALTTRRKYGYARPSLRSGLSDDGETRGTCWIAATRAADTEAPEQPAPIIASMP